MGDKWDEYDEKATVLLPCGYRDTNYPGVCVTPDGNKYNPYRFVCDACRARPAVAAELRGKGERIAKLEAMARLVKTFTLHILLKQIDAALGGGRPK